MIDGDSLRIGIIGGGQLGRMLILAGRPLGFKFGILDTSAAAPAAVLADKVVLGTLYDAPALKELVSWADVTTFEIEHTDTHVLAELVRRGERIVPEVRLLALINDKLAQKQALADAGVPVPRFWTEHPGSYPIVQKTRHGGYDGRGVAVLAGPAETELQGQAFYEQKIDLRAELAVLVARSSSEVTAYPVVDMEFHDDANLVKRVVIPARVPEDVQARATELAIRSVEVLDGRGIIAVEIFWADTGDLLVNEIAPRPHNSGHLTIEACETSQYEQHLRAICDLPLGSTRLRNPAASVNLLGGPGSSGAADLQNLVSLLSYPRTHVHWYDKAEVRPFRKMGHVTTTADTPERAVQATEEFGDLIWIGGRGE